MSTDEERRRAVVEAFDARATLNDKIAAAEARLPEGVVIYAAFRLSDDPAINSMFPDLWSVEAGNTRDRKRDVRAYGRTLDEALDHLAERGGSVDDPVAEAIRAWGRKVRAAAGDAEVWAAGERDALSAGFTVRHVEIRQYCVRLWGTPKRTEARAAWEGARQQLWGRRVLRYFVRRLAHAGVQPVSVPRLEIIPRRQYRRRMMLHQLCVRAIRADELPAGTMVPDHVWTVNVAEQLPTNIDWTKDGRDG